MRTLLRFSITLIKALYCSVVPSSIIYLIINMTAVHSVDPVSWVSCTVCFGTGLSVGIWVAGGRTFFYKKVSDTG